MSCGKNAEGLGEEASADMQAAEALFVENPTDYSHRNWVAKRSRYELLLLDNEEKGSWFVPENL